MTKCAYLQLKVAYCEEKAMEAMRNGDEKLLEFFRNARDGFQARLDRMTLKEAEDEHR